MHTRHHRADGSPALPWILTAITGLLEFCSRETGAARAAAHHLISTLAVVGSERVQQLALQSGVVESTLASAASWDEKEAAMTHVSYSHRSLDPGLREKWVGHLVDSLEPSQDDDEAFGAVDKVVHKLELLVGAVHAGHAGSGREMFSRGLRQAADLPRHISFTGVPGYSRKIRASLCMSRAGRGRDRFGPSLLKSAWEASRCFGAKKTRRDRPDAWSEALPCLTAIAVL